MLPPKDVDITSEEARIDVVENHIATQYHICGSCAMGEATDAKLKVRGVNHLRIIGKSADSLTCVGSFDVHADSLI